MALLRADVILSPCPCCPAKVGKPCYRAKDDPEKDGTRKSFHRDRWIVARRAHHTVW